MLLDLEFIESENIRCLKIDWTRHKTGIGHVIHFFAHRENWLLCPMHSLATYLVTQASNSSGGNLFPEKKKGFLKRINQMFKNCAMYWLEDTRHGKPLAFPLDGSSHSLRRTCFTNTAANSNVAPQQMDRRGGIASGFSTRDYYIDYNEAIDRKIGRLIAGKCNYITDASAHIVNI